MKIICIKILSNSGITLLDSQIDDLSTKWGLDASFIKHLKEVGLHKVWVRTDELNRLVAYIAPGTNNKIEIEPSFIGKVTVELIKSIIPVKNPTREGRDKKKDKITIPLDLKSIFCVNLKIPTDQLTKIAKFYSIDANYFLDLKAGGCQKVWIQSDVNQFVCASDNGYDVYFNDKFLPITQSQLNSILNISPLTIPQLKKRARGIVDILSDGLKEEVKQEVKKPKKLKSLSVDAILDKISEFGIHSLTLQEKEFLDEASKK